MKYSEFQSEFDAGLSDGLPGDMSLSALPYETLVSEWRALCASRGFSLFEFCVGTPVRRMLCVRIGAERTSQIMISAGVHGDDPVTPWALLDMVRNDALDPRFGYMLWCCVNPTGYADGMRSNVGGIDVNRSFGASTGRSPEADLIAAVCARMKFALVLDLHEDFEADGFYCYEATRHAGTRRVGKAILGNLRRNGFELQQLGTGFDLGYSAVFLQTHCRLDRGIVSLRHGSHDLDLAGGTMLTTHMLRRGHTGHAVTIETPSRRDWNERLAMQRIAVLGAIEQLAIRTARANLRYAPRCSKTTTDLPVTP